MPVACICATISSRTLKGNLIFAIGYALRMSSEHSPIDARRHALALESERYKKLREHHASIRQVLIEAPDSPYSRALIERAQEQIDTWERLQTCSFFYVRAWRRVLRNPGTRLRELVDGTSDMKFAMLQNSPFGFAFNDSELRAST